MSARLTKNPSSKVRGFYRCPGLASSTVRRAVPAGSLLLCSVLIGCEAGAVLDEADQALVDAREAIAAGDSASAMDLLDASIGSKPDPWSYYERARLHSENGDDDAAQADVVAGLDIDPEHSELLWLQKQLKKPKRSRFKGKSGQPPSATK